MAPVEDIVTAVTSTVLRLSIYVFLRWIPTTIVPPLVFTLPAIYIVSFFTSLWKTSPYQILSDEIDIITRETTIGQGEDSSSEEIELLEGSEETDEPLQELDVQETLTVEKKDPQIWKTLLSGLPSPSSAFWSWTTFTINMALVGMAADLMYRTPIFYPAHDLSFTRVGYVSDTTADILIREPHLVELPIFVSYRRADPPLSLSSGNRPHDTAWKAVGKISELSSETDFTSSVTIRRLKSDTKYQYTVSTNHTGYFITAPSIGTVSKRNADKYTFLHSSCIKPRVPYSIFDHPLHFPGFKHLAKWIPQLRAHFMLFLGDFIYIDVPWRMGTDAETYRREYRQVYASPDWSSVSDQLPWIHVIDDHEIANDWDKNTTGVYQSAFDPWRHYQMSVNPPAARSGETYFSFTQGPASFFLIDTRRYRENEFEKSTNDSTKTMLGKQQLFDLLAWLKKPAPQGVKWKVVVTSIPFTKNWRFGGEDTWAGYLGERQIILEAMWDVGLRGGVGVIVLSGDRHEFAATAFPPPKEGKWPMAATVHEFSTSPLSMFYLPVRTYKQQDDEDVCIKYLPDGNSKFGAVEITSPAASDQSLLHYRLFVDGEEAWSYTMTSPPESGGSTRGIDAIWG